MPTASATVARVCSSSSGVSLASSFSSTMRRALRDGLVEQALQADRVSRAGLEGPLILAQDRAEAHVAKIDLVVTPAAGRFEEQCENARSAGRRRRKESCPRELLGPVTDGRQVGRGVSKGAVGLADDERGRILVDEDADAPRRSAGRGRIRQRVDDVAQHRLVIAFAQCHVELDFEPTIDGLERLEALGQEFLPKRRFSASPA